jgi:hypothetical protein
VPLGEDEPLNATVDDASDRSPLRRRRYGFDPAEQVGIVLTVVATALVARFAFSTARYLAIDVSCDYNGWYPSLTLACAGAFVALCGLAAGVVAAGTPPRRVGLVAIGVNAGLVLLAVVLFAVAFEHSPLCIDM